MPGKSEQIRRLRVDFESNAAACRSAAEQIRAIVNTLPQDRYKGQQEMLRLIAAALEAQAVDVTIEGRLGDPERLGLLGLLGRSRVGDAAAALTALGTLALAGVALHDTAFDDARQACEIVVSYSDGLVDDANQALQDAKWDELRSWDEQMDDFREREGIVTTEAADSGLADSTSFETLSDSQQDGLKPPDDVRRQGPADIRDIADDLSEEQRREIAYQFMAEGDNEQEWREASIDHDDHND